MDYLFLSFLKQRPEKVNVCGGGMSWIYEQSSGLLRLKSPSARPCQHYCSTAALEISRGVQGVSPPPSPAGATTSPAPVASPCTPPSTRRIDKKFPINKLLHCVLTLFFLSEKLPNSSLMHVFRWSLRLCSTQDEFLITWERSRNDKIFPFRLRSLWLPNILISSICSISRLPSNVGIPDCSLSQGSIYFNFLTRIMSAGKLLFPKD